KKNMFSFKWCQINCLNCHSIAIKSKFLFLIMNNRPFYSTNTNVYDQSVFSSAPSNFNGQNVLVSQEQQRKMFDTLNTSIMGLPYDNPHQMHPCPGNCMQAQRQFMPGGVMFSFNSQPLPQQNPPFMSQQMYPMLRGGILK
ncbi:hypothetical protein NQ314_015156, partial [Rhamnusium bicolor]